MQTGLDDNRLQVGRIATALCYALVCMYVWMDICNRVCVCVCVYARYLRSVIEDVY